MAAAVGNQYAAKAKRWQKALERALARVSKHSVDAGLDQIADKVVELAAQGDQWAVREVGDRLDGKPMVAIEHSGTVEHVTEIPDSQLVAIATGTTDENHELH